MNNTFCLKNLIKEPTCYKLNTPTFVDLIFTNQKRVFMKRSAFEVVCLICINWQLRFFGKLYHRVTLKRYSIETTNYLIKAILKTISKHNYLHLKVSVFGVFLVRIFPHSDWIRRDTAECGKYGPEKLLIQTFLRGD